MKLLRVIGCEGFQRTEIRNMDKIEQLKGSVAKCNIWLSDLQVFRFLINNEERVALDSKLIRIKGGHYK